MNIVVVGGGTVGKFGNDFVKKARSEGHRVINLSHIDHQTGHADDREINYKNLDINKPVLAQVANDLGDIDIILFNQNGPCYPDTIEHLFGYPNLYNYHETMMSKVIMPHLIISLLYNNLKEGSKVVYLSSSMAFEYERQHYQAGAGYPGAKSFGAHLILSMARTRTKNVTFSIVCPFFIYNDPDQYSQALENIYKYVFVHDDTYNGKFVAQLKSWNTIPEEFSVKYG